MEIILRNRGGGKTAELIRRSAETGIYILTKDYTRSRAAVTQAHDMGMDIPFPVTVADYMHSDGFNGSFINKIYIDDADDILQAIFCRVQIEAATITKD